MFVDTIPSWEGRDDGFFVENPHPELVDHDELRDLLDVASALITAKLVDSFIVIGPSPPT